LLDRFTHLVRGNDVPLASEMSQAKAWDVIVAEGVAAAGPGRRRSGDRDSRLALKTRAIVEGGGAS